MTKQPSATTNRNNTIALNDIDSNDALDGDIDSFDDGDNKALREQYAKTVGDNKGVTFKASFFFCLYSSTVKKRAKKKEKKREKVDGHIFKKSGV